MPDRSLDSAEGPPPVRFDAAFTAASIVLAPLRCAANCAARDREPEGDAPRYLGRAWELHVHPDLVQPGIRSRQSERFASADRRSIPEPTVNTERLHPESAGLERQPALPAGMLGVRTDREKARPGTRAYDRLATALRADDLREQVPDVDTSGAESCAVDCGRARDVAWHVVISERRQQRRPATLGNRAGLGEHIAHESRLPRRVEVVGSCVERRVEGGLPVEGERSHGRNEDVALFQELADALRALDICDGGLESVVRFGQLPQPGLVASQRGRDVSPIRTRASVTSRPVYPVAPQSTTRPDMTALRLTGSGRRWWPPMCG